MTTWRRVPGALGRVFTNDLLGSASAISFQICQGTIPVMLAALALLGFLDLQDVWRDEIAPRLSKQLSPDIFGLLDASVEKLLSSQRVFWLTSGIAFALWQISGAVRATMTALADVYDFDDTRSIWRKLGISLVLSVALCVAVLLAVAALELLPKLLEAAGWGILPRNVLRWLLSILALYTVVLLLMRFGPPHGRHISGRSLSSLLVVCGWLIVSLLFRWYVANVADYSSIFGNLASIFVLMTYVYLSVAVFLVGARLDGMARDTDFEEAR